MLCRGLDCRIFLLFMFELELYAAYCKSRSFVFNASSGCCGDLISERHAKRKIFVTNYKKIA